MALCSLFSLHRRLDWYRRIIREQRAVRGARAGGDAAAAELASDLAHAEALMAQNLDRLKQIIWYIAGETTPREAGSRIPVEPHPPSAGCGWHLPARVDRRGRLGRRGGMKVWFRRHGLDLRASPCFCFDAETPQSCLMIRRL